MRQDLAYSLVLCALAACDSFFVLYFRGRPRAMVTCASATQLTASGSAIVEMTQSDAQSPFPILVLSKMAYCPECQFDDVMSNFF